MKVISIGAMLLLYCMSASAQFNDNGFKSLTPSVRTDYVYSVTGTSSSPLQHTACIFPSTELRCNNPPTVYKQSNFWSQNVTNMFSGWALVMNNEPSEARNPSTGLPINPGPPDQSVSRVLPGNGVYGFETINGSNNFPGDTHVRAHLVLDIDGAPQQPVPANLGPTPFMGLFYSSQGSFSSNHAPATLFTGNVATPTILRWSQRLWDVQAPNSIDTILPTPGSTQPGTLAGWVQVIAKWGTHPKFIQIRTYSYWESGKNKEGNAYPSDYLQSGINAEGGWNWPYPQSFFNPGAELLDLSLAGLKNLCGITLPDMSVNRGVDLTYTLDLQALFKCGAVAQVWNEKMPLNTPIPVVTIGWAEEGTGVGGGIWTDVHSMGVYTAGNLPAAAVLKPNGAIENASASSEDQPGVAEIRSHLGAWGKQISNASSKPALR